MKSNLVQDKSFAFAIATINLYKQLVSNSREYVISKQLLRSGTSVGANIREAQNAESKKDFIHKLSISQKEVDESLYWLELLFETKYIDQKIFEEHHREGTSILKLIKSIIVSAKENSSS